MAFDYAKYKLESPRSIRLLEIIPVGVNDYQNEIKLSMRVVSLDPTNLIPGQAEDPPDRPTVRFDEDVTTRPQEYFLVDESSRSDVHSRTDVDSRTNVNKKVPRRFSRLFSKVKGRPVPKESHESEASREPHKSVPLTAPLLEEPARRDRFQWGNYVAMSYTWGPKEGWEMTYDERKGEEDKIEKDGLDPDELDYTPVLRTNMRTVVIDGCRVRVRYSLWAALLRFRELSHFKQDVSERGPFQHPVGLWNDALCINQGDEVEKIAQISMMSEIYRQAGNIIVDIGDGSRRGEDTPWIIEYLQDISVYYRTELYEAMDHADSITAHQFRYHAKRKLDESAEQHIEQMQADLKSDRLQEVNDQAAIYMYDFFDRPYWRRLWVVQELAMGYPSTPILCGGWVTQWRYIRDAALLLSLVRDDLTDAMQRALIRAGRLMKREPSFEHVAAVAQLSTFGRWKGLGDTQHVANGPSAVMNYVTYNLPALPHFQTLQGSSITQALMIAANTSCRDAADRVNGLLALPALAQLPINPSEEITPAELYAKFAAACIRGDRTLDIFALLDGSNDGTKEAMILPSWCPYFHYENKIGRIEGTWKAPGNSGSWYRPHGNVVTYTLDDIMVPNPELRGEALFCSGWMVDSVDGLGGLSESDFQTSQIGPGHQAGVLKPRFTPRWEAVSNSIDNIIWMTLVGGTSVNGTKAPESFRCLLNAFPDKWPDDMPLYKRNWDFFQANRALQVAGKPLDSYFTLQPAQSYTQGVLEGVGEHSHREIADAHRAMETRTKLRRMMTTSNRALLGLVPASTQQGDAIIILKHHSRPLIAAGVTSEDGERSWLRIRGEAYIPGIMQGELVEELYETPIDRFEFR